MNRPASPAVSQPSAAFPARPNGYEPGRTPGFVATAGGRRPAPKHGVRPAAAWQTAVNRDLKD